MSKQVSVPGSFFIKSALRDYTRPFQGIVRELLQNARDAGATNVDFTIAKDEQGHHTLMCRDNGCGMSKETIENKLMALGETTKTGSDSTGGFGVAKVLLFFCHRSYEIRTNGLLVTGSGSHYESPIAVTPIQGTQITIDLDDTIAAKVTDHVAAASTEIKTSYLPNLTITVNGSIIKALVKQGNKIATVENKITVHRVKLPKGTTTCYAYVRVRGLFMFHHYVGDTDSMLHIELSGYSTDILTSNRNSFQEPWGQQVANLCHKFVTNRQAVKTESSKQYAFEGQDSYSSADYKLKQEEIRRVMVRVNEMLAQIESTQTGAERAEIQAAVQQTVADTAMPAGQVAALMAQVSEIIESGRYTEAKLAKHYNVYTEGFKNLPVAWAPDALNEWKTDLIVLWSAIVGKTLVIAGKPNVEFDVGFAIYHKSVEEKALALYAQHSGKHLFYVNPQSYGDETMLPIINKKRRPELILWLMQLACHEVTHFLGFSGHDERFVVAEADLMRKMVANYREFLAMGGKKLLVI